MRLPPRDLATYLAARLVPAFATMCLTFVCIHWLSAEEYATYSLTLLSAGVAAGFVGGVSGQAMLRYSHELSPQALRRGMIGLPLAVAVIASPWVLIYLGRGIGLSAAAWIATATIPLLALMDTRRSLFVARARADAVFALDAWRAGSALLIAFALLHGWGPHAAAPMLAQLLSIVACLLLVRAGRAPGPPSHGTRTVDAHYVGYGLGIAGWMAVIVGLSVAERAVLATSSGLAASGHYAAQADVINAVFSAGGGALASAMMPAYLAQSHAPDATALRRLRQVGLLGVLAIAGLCLLLGIVLAAAGVGRISQALTADVGTAGTLVAAGAVWTAAGFVQKPLELSGHTGRIFGGVVVVLLMFLLIAPGLAGRLGPTGVAAAKLVAGLAYIAFAFAAARGSR